MKEVKSRTGEVELQTDEYVPPGPVRIASMLKKLDAMPATNMDLKKAVREKRLLNVDKSTACRVVKGDTWQT